MIILDGIQCIIKLLMYGIIFACIIKGDPLSAIALCCFMFVVMYDLRV